jgi:hypothetical protein
MSGILENLGVPVDDQTALKRLLDQWDAERYALQHQIATLQGRLNALAKASEGVRALLEVSGPEQLAFEPGPEESQTTEVAYGREVEYLVPGAQGPAEEVPKGKEAARLVLQSDTSRFWNVRDVSDEQIRRGWAEPRPPGTKGNPPARAALMRLKDQYPDNVEMVETPFMAFKWTDHPSPSRNGSGASHTEEA